MTSIKYKRLLSLLFMMFLTFMLTACNQNSNAVQGSANELQRAEENIKQDTKNVQNDGYDKFSQVQLGMTESEVNAILGEPVSVDKAYYYYNVIINGEDAEVTVWINTTTGLVTYKRGGFTSDKYRAAFADSKTDLSKVSELENDTLKTYDDCVAAFKTSGYLITLNEDGSTTYMWVDANHGYMTVSFRPDGTVKNYSGFC